MTPLQHLRADLPKISLIFKIHRLATDHEVQFLAREKFNSDQWRNLAENQLTQVYAILINRRAKREQSARLEKQQLKLLF